MPEETNITPQKGDFNANGKIEASDINSLSEHIGLVVCTDVNDVGIVGDIDGNGYLNDNDYETLNTFLLGGTIFRINSNSDVNDDGIVDTKDRSKLKTYTGSGSKIY